MNKLKLLLPVLLLVAILFALPVAAAGDAETMTVYVDQTNGLDTNNGLSEATAVKTLDKAYALLDENLTDSGTGTIILVSDYTHTFAANKESIATSVTSHSYMVVLKGKSADVEFVLKNSGQSYLQLLGPTTIEQLCIYTTGTNKFVSIHGAGVNGKLIIGEGVSGGNSADWYVSLSPIPHTGGNEDTNAGKAIYLEVNSGDWKSIYATSYTNSCKGNATCVINGGNITKLSVRYSATFTGNVRMELNGGTITELCPVGANAKAVVTGDITIVRAGAKINKTTEQGTHNGTLTFVDAEPTATLVLTVNSEKYTVTLYSGLSGTTKIEAANKVTENGITKYYYHVPAGNYRTNVSRSGFYTVNKVRVVTPEQVGKETVIDVTTQMRVFDGDTIAKYQSTTYKEFSDAMMAMLNNHEGLWYQEYSQYLTTPVFNDAKKHQQTTQEEMEAYIQSLDDANDNMYVYSIGKSDADKDIPIVIFSLTDLSQAETLEEAAALIRANEKLTVHYQAQIHGNEPAGGEAALAAIGRLDTAAYGDRLLEKMNIYVIPRLNPDGSENYVRVEPTTGLNGNRDYLMARTVNVQAQHYVYNLFMPELAIDGHEYTVDNANNNQAYKDMMVAYGHNGNSGEAITTLAEDLCLAIKDDIQAKGLDYSFYTNITNNDYSVSGTMYMGLRGSVSFLLESRGIAFGNHTMDRRVIAHLISIDTLLNYAYENTEVVQAASDAERQRIITNGLTYEDSDVLVVAHKQVSDDRLTHTNDKYNYMTGEKTGTNNVVPKKYVADVTRIRPTAYVIPAGQEWTQDVLDLLDLHAITYEFYEAGTAFNLQQYLGTTEAITLSEEKAVMFGKGAYVITMNQPSALILTSLMEPDLKNEYFEETDSGNTNIYGNLAQLQVIPGNGENFPIYRYIRDLNAQGKVDTTEAPKVEYKVYIHSTNGLDTNDAYSEAAPAKTIEHAFAQLDTLMGNAPEGTSGTVVFLDLYELGEMGYTFPSHDYPVVMTSKTGAEGLAKKYKSSNGYIGFGGDVTLENMTIWPSGDNDYYYILANGHNLTVKETVITKASSANTYFSIAAGGYNNTVLGVSGSNPLVVDNKLTILGGTWKFVYGSGYTGNVKGTTNVIVENASILNYMASYSVTHNGTVNVTMRNVEVRDGIIYMGNASKNNVSNSTLILGEGVDVKTIYTGSRDAGNVSKNATIIVDGADMTGIEIVRGTKTSGTVGKNILAYKSGTIGTIVGYDEVQVLVDGQLYSVSAAMTNLSLEPAKTGFGYKAAFTCDDAVKSMIVSQGFSLWITEDIVVNRSMSAFQENMTLRLKNFLIEEYGSAKVNAKVYMELSNGLIIETEVVSYSMQDMIEMIASDLTRYSVDQIRAVRNMLVGYSVVTSWNIDKLLAWTPTEEN